MHELADDPPVEERLADALSATDATVATAETCTGGLIGSLLTDVPGSSAYFDRTVVPYSYDSLRDLLGITREALDEHGVVSAPITRQLAQRARDTADTTWGISTTGIAGPSGGTNEKPVGTAFIGVAFAGPWETRTSYARVERHQFDGDRLRIKEHIARQALESLLEATDTV